MKILVVEDDERNLKLFRKILDAKGYNTLGAASGEDGLRIAEAELPSLILMDIKLLGMSGIQAAGFLKEGPATGRIPIIAVTGRPRCELPEECFDNYIPKPITDIGSFLKVVADTAGTGTY